MNCSTPIARPLVMLAFCTMLASWAKSASGVTLIEDGKPQCTIVVRREDTTTLRAAEDLRYHLRKMSGAEVPMTHNASNVQGIGIYIDTKPLDVNVSGRVIGRKMLWPDGYVIEILEFDDTSGVFLSSPRPEGIRNAVYGLLEDHLGCHWFTPGEIGEHVPQRRTVTLNIPGNRDIAKPDFEIRRPWYNCNANRHLTREETSQLNQWYHRNRRGGTQGSVGHGWGQMFTQEVFDSIDEDGDGVSDLYPLVDGKRIAGGLCMSHPKVVDIAAQWFINFFKGRPEYDHWSFSQGDSMQFCECDRCKAMGSNHGAHMLIMSNDVIEKINRVHPTKRITVMTYEKTLEPPEEFIAANTNINSSVVSMGVDQVLPKTQAPHFRRQAERWMTMLPRAWSRDYISWMSGPWPLFQALQKTRDFYVSIGYTGVVDEYLGRNLGTNTHMWLSMRMSWDTDLRVDDLLNEFYRSYFGAAGQQMRSVYEQIERHMLSLGPVGTSMAIIPKLYPPELIDACLARVALAKTKVSADPTLVARIERDENCLKATRLWLRFFSTLGQANRKVGGIGRQQATDACQTYLDFVKSLDGTGTLGSGGMRLFAERLMSQEGLAGGGTYFTEGFRNGPWPGVFAYYDTLDQGGKITDAKDWSGFEAGPEGLYLKPHVVGEIVYEVRTTEDLRFKQISLPGGRTGWCSRIHMALPEGGHNQIQVSLDQGQTWITAFEDLDTEISVLKYDLTPFAGGTNRFLLKLRVENTEEEILALDSWVLQGVTEPNDPAEQ